MSNPAQINTPLVLWANSSKNVIQDAWQSNGTIDAVRLTQGDTLAVQLHWITDFAGEGAVHEEVIWPSAANVTLALGRIDAAPEAGVFSLSYGGQTTAEIPFSATGVQIASALNALASIAAEGGVTAVRTGTIYKVVWNSTGVLASSLAVVSNDLLPQCTIGISLARAGSSTATGIYNLHIKQAPVAACTVWETPNAPEISVELESSIGLMRIWVLKLERLPRSGAFNLQWVSSAGAPGISWRISLYTISAFEIRRALLAAEGWNQTWFADVIDRGPMEWEIRISISTNVPGAVAPVVSLTSTRVVVQDFSIKSGLLSLNTLEVEGLLAGQSSVDVVMEVEVEMGGTRRTIVQAQAYIVNDLIDTDVYDLVQWGDVLPADSVLRFDTSQALTAGQQLQVRNNIGALGASSLDALIAKDDELELLLGSISLTTDELAAINGSATPSATNLFLTKSASDALYATASHQHLIANIIGLQTTLDLYDATIGSLEVSISTLQSSKANSYHTQPTSTITGLDTVLANFDTRINGFAAFNHTHVIADVATLGTQLTALNDFMAEAEPKVLTDNQKDALDNGESPTSINPFATVSRVQSMINGLNAGFATELWTQQQITAAITALTFTTVDGDQPNPSVGPNLLKVDYPLEILIAHDGVSYWTPARLA